MWLYLQCKEELRYEFHDLHVSTYFEYEDIVLQSVYFKIYQNNFVLKNVHIFIINM